MKTYIGLRLLSFVSEFLKKNKIISDELCLTQIITNLVSNSMKFTEFGSVTVTSNEKRINGNDFEIELSITVEDTGIGISPENSQKLFNEFTQVESSSKYGGSGLGLSICKQLVEMLGDYFSQIFLIFQFYFKKNQRKFSNIFRFPTFL